MILVFVLVTFVLFGLFWGGSLVAQGYFYQNPADRLALRAAIAALIVGLFIGFWVYLDKKNPGKYDTFNEFKDETSHSFHEFEAVRWQYDPVNKGVKKDAQGKPVETNVKFKQEGGGKNPFKEEGTGKHFTLNSSDMMTAALIAPREDGTPARFNANMKKDSLVYAESSERDRRFTEENGKRYIKHSPIGVMYIPSTGVVVISLLLNFALFAVWFIAFWPVLRFSAGHAAGFTVVFGLIVMLLVMPMLFKPNREANRPAEAPGQAAP